MIVLAGGAAKFYRGISGLTKPQSNSQVRDLLVKSDEAAADANGKSIAIAPAFDALLGEFDRLGVAEFRAQKQDDSARLSGQFKQVSDALGTASGLLLEAAKLESNPKLTSFITARSKSYEMCIEANSKNIEIIAATMDKSLADSAAVLARIESIVADRNAAQEAAQKAAATADELLKQP